METYLSAIVDFYLKPQKRIWMPAQPDTTITIASPKKVEENRTKNLSQEEASHRLSFLANIVDTEGYAIKDTNTNLREDIASEAASAQDIFESSNYQTISQDLQQNNTARHDQLVAQMRNAINANNNIATHNTTISHQVQSPQPTAFPAQQLAAAQQPAAFAQTTPATPITTPQFTTTTPFAPPTFTTNVPPAAAILTQPQPSSTQIQQTPTIIPPTQPAPTEADVNNAIATSSATIQPDLNEIHDALRQNDDPFAPLTQQSVQNSELLPQDIPITPEDTPLAEPAEPQPEQQKSNISPEDLQNLANNTDYSIETLAKQAKRLEEKQANNNQEVYISLH